MRYLFFICRVLCITFASVCVVSCGVFPSIEYRDYPNVSIEENRTTPLSQDRLALSDQEISNFSGDRNIFIGIAASGGGSRAAVFTAAVMEQLEALGFMKEVRVISSVSGAGLPSAYYAINGNKLDYDNKKGWNEFHEAMERDFRTAFVWKYFNPINMALTFFTTLDRSDLLADVFDEQVFNNSTFGNIAEISWGPRSPLWFANATDITDGGKRFIFEEGNFRTLKSDIRRLKISRAVGASAAFPGALNSVTLAKFGMQNNKSFVHLIDGGVSDNLGIETIVDAAKIFGENHRQNSSMNMTAQESKFSCFIFLVDAFIPYDGKNDARTNEPRQSSLSYIIDYNFSNAFDSLLANRRRTQLNELGFPLIHPNSPISNPNLKSFYETSRQMSVTKEHAYMRIRNFSFNILENGHDQPRPKLFDNGQLDSADSKKYSCVVWHIPISGIRSLLKISESKNEEGKSKSYAQMTMIFNKEDPILNYRNKLFNLVSNVETDFDLVGPSKCTKKELGAAIRSAARVAVREDPEAGRIACDWFRSTFPGKDFACDPMHKDNYSVALSSSSENVNCMD